MLYNTLIHAVKVALKRRETGGGVSHISASACIMYLDYRKAGLLCRLISRDRREANTDTPTYIHPAAPLACLDWYPPKLHTNTWPDMSVCFGETVREGFYIGLLWVEENVSCHETKWEHRVSDCSAWQNGANMRHVLTRLVIAAALTPGLHQLDSNTSMLLTINQRHCRLQWVKGT